jgi:hypothetical protein
MKKETEKKTELSKSQFGVNFIDWDLGIDLNYSWIELIRATVRIITRKVKFTPQPIRKGTSHPR